MYGIAFRRGLARRFLLRNSHLSHACARSHEAIRLNPALHRFQSKEPCLVRCPISTPRDLAAVRCHSRPAASDLGTERVEVTPKGGFESDRERAPKSRPPSSIPGGAGALRVERRSGRSRERRRARATIYAGDATLTWRSYARAARQRRRARRDSVRVAPYAREFDGVALRVQCATSVRQLAPGAHCLRRIRRCAASFSRSPPACARWPSMRTSNSTRRRRRGFDRPASAQERRQEP